jgi:WD40 repeat protein
LPPSSGTHEFVQSILTLPRGIIISGGESGALRVHRLAASKDERPSTMLGHTGAIMCMDAQRHAEDGTVLSRSSTLFTGSVDHHVGMYDLESGDDCMLIACGLPLWTITSACGIWNRAMIACGLHADCMLIAC